MTKNLLIISYQRLIINGTAGEAVGCGLVQAALDRGFRTTYLGLVPPDARLSEGIAYTPPKNASLLTQHYATYRQKPGGPITTFFYNFDHAALEYLPDPCPVLEETYDGVVALDSLPISLGNRVKAGIRIGILGDPVGQRLWHSNFLKWRRRFVIGTVLWFLELRYFCKKYKANWKMGMFGTAHAKRCAKIFNQPVLDLRPFLTPQTSHPVENVPASAPRVLVFGGTLATTASRLAYQFLRDELLPALRSTLGPGTFTFRIVGSTMPDYSELAKRFPEVVLKGRVPVFEAELTDGDVFVLPMNYPVGVRTRVCAALQAGCYSVCHSSVLGNMPELATCDSVQMADTADSFAQAIAALPMDAESRLKRRKAAQAFFTAHYACDVAAKPILDCIGAAQ